MSNMTYFEEGRRLWREHRDVSKLVYARGEPLRSDPKNAVTLLAAYVSHRYSGGARSRVREAIQKENDNGAFDKRSRRGAAGARRRTILGRPKPGAKQAVLASRYAHGGSIRVYTLER